MCEKQKFKCTGCEVIIEGNPKRLEGIHCFNCGSPIVPIASNNTVTIMVNIDGKKLCKELKAFKKNKKKERIIQAIINVAKENKFTVEEAYDLIDECKAEIYKRYLIAYCE